MSIRLSGILLFFILRLERSEFSVKSWQAEQTKFPRDFPVLAARCKESPRSTLADESRLEHQRRAKTQGHPSHRGSGATPRRGAGAAGRELPWAWEPAPGMGAEQSGPCRGSRRIRLHPPPRGAAPAPAPAARRGDSEGPFACHQASGRGDCTAIISQIGLFIIWAPSGYFTVAISK